MKDSDTGNECLDYAINLGQKDQAEKMIDRAISIGVGFKEIYFMINGDYPMKRISSIIANIQYYEFSSDLQEKLMNLASGYFEGQK